MNRSPKAFNGTLNAVPEPKPARPPARPPEPPIRWREDSCNGAPDCHEPVHACALTGHMYCRRHCSHGG